MHGKGTYTDATKEIHPDTWRPRCSIGCLVIGRRQAGGVGLFTSAQCGDCRAPTGAAPATAKGKVAHAEPLDSPEKIRFKQSSQGIRIELPRPKPASDDAVVFKLSPARWYRKAMPADPHAARAACGTSAIDQSPLPGRWPRGRRMVRTAAPAANGARGMWVLVDSPDICHYPSRRTRSKLAILARPDGCAPTHSRREK
jgi:hypothetical protein